MSDTQEEIRISSETSVLSQDAGTITKSEGKEKFIVKKATNHNEISIMESIWNQIKRKVDLISFQKRIDICILLYGAMIPYIIDIFQSYMKGDTPTYFPLVICFVLIAICKWLSKYCTYLQENRDAINDVHLTDLKNLIDEVDAISKDSEDR